MGDHRFRAEEDELQIHRQRPIPLILCDVQDITSFNVLRKNFAPMLLWAGIVVVFTAIGFATWFVGLVVAMPIIGHATWHAYRDAVERAPG